MPICAWRRAGSPTRRAASISGSCSSSPRARIACCARTGAWARQRSATPRWCASCSRRRALSSTSEGASARTRAGDPARSRRAEPEGGLREDRLELGLQGALGGGPHDLLCLGALLEEDERGDREDLVPGGGLLVLVDVELDDAQVFAL